MCCRGSRLQIFFCFSTHIISEYNCTSPFSTPLFSVSSLCHLRYLLLDIVMLDRFRGRVKHFRIYHRDDRLSQTGKRYFLYDSDFHAPTIRELIQYYTAHRLARRNAGPPLAENDAATDELKLSMAIPPLCIQDQ